MNAKWYISTLLFIALCFGAFQEQVHEPNQEIILEFVDTSIHKKNVENTITEVKEKLLEIGVSNIVIQETKKGTLKICYYSTIDTKNIKSALTNANQLAVNHLPENDGKHISNYNIAVHNLTENIDVSNLGDKFVLEIKYQSDRFTIDNFSGFSESIANKANKLFKIAYKVSKNNPFIKDYTSYQEPEVRAGPGIYFV
ncbi:hypothetical protein FDT66_01570 [Polaribacter aestuariivivens]|uniref:DUF541 domain-containing protein n=1 Tax=Polaribacter aestuariivivens TaxID=2304626 RepID=A0A5S3NE92_9FLAO|nr:hypothetical protein [Polaribacter aestuariivivens]TMM32179.1 hypothetical protein FDT66_01570 [Polaribacter aestuariivivens]